LFVKTGIMHIALMTLVSLITLDAVQSTKSIIFNVFENNLIADSF